MIITIDNLRTGLLVWFESKPKWGKDILNALYYEIYEVRSAGATEQWWTATVDRLCQWRAHRGSSKAAIRDRGLQRLDEIADQFSKLTKKNPATEPSIADADLNWEDVARLFDLASEIKPVKSGSGVFPSKLCHFLFPKVFPPMDNEVTGLSEYELYWRGMKDAWCRFKNKVEAMSIIAESIESDQRIHPLYPFETKTMELSHMGYNLRRQTDRLPR
jgi:hypothetical protein